MTAIKMPSDRPLRIAQFTDVHFGIPGRSYHNNRPERTKAYMQYVVDTQKPDLIVCTGDIIMSTGVKKLGELVDLMESYKTPWTFAFGNHDAENMEEGDNKKAYSKYLDSCDAKYLLYDSGYVEEENNRYGNFSIPVLNNDGTKLVGAVILMDTGTYNRAINSYDSITECQIAWYKDEIDRLNILYEGGGTVPSMVFGHIALPEFQTAYKAALASDGARFVIEQPLPADAIESLKNEGPTNTNTGFFSAMKEKGSTKAFLCGHAHLLNFQVELDGIVLGFAPQTGFSTLFPDNDMPRETYIYCVGENFNFTTISCIEDGRTIGLEYCGTFDSTAEYDESKGAYTASYAFNCGNHIVFSYNGVRLTTENTKFTGDFADFYLSDDGKLIFQGMAAATCKFTFDSSKKELYIETHEVEADPNAPTSVPFDTMDCDAGEDAITLWTKAGTKLKSVLDASIGTVDWIGSNWRYYVVVDREGRIAYAVIYPATGYGGPCEKSYYTHPCYADYRTNPAIRILDGYADDYASGGIGYNLYEIVVPEGGFAFTGHDAAIYKMVDMLSQGTVENYSASYINTRSLIKSNIRVSYDVEKKMISILEKKMISICS